MKKTLSMVLTAVMMFVLSVTVFAEDLPTELPPASVGVIDTIINFFADILRALGEIIGYVFK